MEYLHLFEKDFKLKDRVRTTTKYSYVSKIKLKFKILNNGDSEELVNDFFTFLKEEIDFYNREGYVKYTIKKKQKKYGKFVGVCKDVVFAGIGFMEFVDEYKIVFKGKVKVSKEKIEAWLIDLIEFFALQLWKEYNAVLMIKKMEVEQRNYM